MAGKAHWEEVYRSKASNEVSWYQPDAKRSLELIQRFVPDRNAALIDVGGGASVLVDGLLAAGYSDLTVLDLSGAALATAKKRLGSIAQGARWVEADVLEYQLLEDGLEVWHDRAVFHFLTSPQDQQRYVEQVRRALRPQGYAIIATFGENGPTRCSGLEVQRYSPEALQSVFGPNFRMVDSSTETHTTPAGKPQEFVYCVFQAS